jgi:hypothetical protein
MSALKRRATGKVNDLLQPMSNGVPSLLDSVYVEASLARCRQEVTELQRELMLARTARQARRAAWLGQHGELAEFDGRAT